MPDSSNKQTKAQHAMVHSIQSQSDFEQPANKLRSWGSRPAFHLVYVLFYFVPWLFQAPTKIDVLVAVISIAI